MNEEELWECRREKEKLEEDVIACQREIRRLRSVVRDYECAWGKFRELVQKMLQCGSEAAQKEKSFREIVKLMEDF